MITGYIRRAAIAIALVLVIAAPARAQTYQSDEVAEKLGYLIALGSQCSRPTAHFEANLSVDDKDSVYCGLLDYYDHWNEVDQRLGSHYPYLSRAADIVGHDIVNIATYAHEILAWLSPDRIRLPSSVVCVGGMTEAF